MTMMMLRRTRTTSWAAVTREMIYWCRRSQLHSRTISTEKEKAMRTTVSLSVCSFCPVTSPSAAVSVVVLEDSSCSRWPIYKSLFFTCPQTTSPCPCPWASSPCRCPRTTSPCPCHQASSPCPLTTSPCPWASCPCPQASSPCPCPRTTSPCPQASSPCPLTTSPCPWTSNPWQHNITGCNRQHLNHDSLKDIKDGRLSELFCAVLCTTMWQLYAHSYG